MARSNDVHHVKHFLIADCFHMCAFQRWVWAFRDSKFHVNVNTNNGPERKNRNLKHEFLLTCSDSTLSGLVTAVVEKYLPSLVLK